MTDTTHFASDNNTEGVYIPKAYQFERDMDTISMADGSRYDNVEFADDANEHYIGENLDELVTQQKGLEYIAGMVNNFIKSQKPRLEILESYAHGKNVAIKKGRRRIEENKADYRIAHNYGGYISEFVTSFVISKPVTVTYQGSEDDEGTNDLQDVRDISELNDIDGLNYELAYDASVYGRAFEFHYRKKGDPNDYISVISPKEIFLIRDKTVEKNIIGAIHCPVYNDNLEITLFTERKVYRFNPTPPAKIELKLKENGVTENPYQDIPVVEWWNNRFREGDFEKNLGEINAYDSAQSDTANYMSDLNDAILVLKGDVRLSTAELKEMQDMNILVLESGFSASGQQTTADAGYVYKQYDVGGSEAYKNRLVDSIHLLTNVPKITDENFGTQSGIAMMYKLFGLKQKKESKVRFFTKALKRRYKLIENMRKFNGGEEINADKLTFTFHENLPSDVWAEIKLYVESGGQLSQETLRENATFTNHTKEQERLEKEDNEMQGLSLEEIRFLNAQRE